MSGEAVTIDHRVIVRDERTGPRTYCYCGFATTLRATYDEMVAELYAHLDAGEAAAGGGQWAGAPTLF